MFIYIRQCSNLGFLASLLSLRFQRVLLTSRSPAQTTPPMPPVHTYTVDEDDEGDICPVCDGECTCAPLPSNPLSMAELSLKYAVPDSPPSTPSLKIKLSIPPSMLANRRLQSTSKLSKSAVETTLDSVNAGYTTVPKKRGRPPKAFASSPNHKKTLLVPKSALQNRKRSVLPTRAAIIKKAVAAKNKKRRRVATSDDDDSSSSSALSDVGMDRAAQPDPYPDNDSVQFPTFLSASALSSNDSDSESSSSLSDFSDSSIEAEEENFILTDVKNKKSRVKRESTDDPPLLQKRRTSHNNDWIIRPRKKSEGPSDVEMNDVDSDATEQDDRQDDAEDEDDADATEDEMAMTLDDELDEDGVTTDDHRRRYVGHATGWSEEEDESSFDADLFFANLSGSDSIDSNSDDDDGGHFSPPRHYKHLSLSMAEDGDQSDISGSGMLSECTESGWAGRRRAELESLPFEVTEGWDGQIMFTNGVGDGQGLVDIEFEAHAEQFVASPRKPPRQHTEESDNDGMEGSDVDMSDGGYEEEDGGEGGEGDTTDEELVGEDELPNERAMALFSLPLSVSAINPLSTVSSPTVPASRRGLGKRIWGMESPSPADILAGRVVFWDSDDELSPTSGSDNVGRDGGDDSRRGSMPLGPRKGVFSPSTETRQAVIGEDRKGAAVPSPHPRFNRGRGRTNVGRFSVVSLIYQLSFLLDFLDACAANASCLSFQYTIPCHAPCLQKKNDRCSRVFLLPQGRAPPAQAPSHQSPGESSGQHPGCRRPPFVVYPGGECLAFDPATLTFLGRIG